MYSKILSVALLMCASVCSHAQILSIDYSLNWNKMNNFDSKTEFSPLNFSVKFGIPLVVINQDNEFSYFDLDDLNETNKPSLGLVSGLQFQSKRACIGQNENININYLNIPLMATCRIPVWKLQEMNFFFDVSAGGYGAYAVRGRTTFNGEKYNIFSNNIGNQYNRFDAGLRFSIGLSNMESNVLSIDYEYGLVDVIKNNQGKKVCNSAVFLTFSLSSIWSFLGQSVRGI